MATILLIKPKTFPLPEAPNSGITIVAISAEIANVEMLSLKPMEVKYIFYKEGLEPYNNGQNAFVPKKIQIGKDTYIDAVSMLFSNDIEKVYQVSSIIAKANQYELLPLEEQKYLIKAFE